VAVDVDNLARFSLEHGDRLANNLNQAIAIRIREQIQTFFKRSMNCRLYHIYSDLFYLVLNEVSLEEAREKAELLRQDLTRPYQVDALRIHNEQVQIADSTIDLSEVTVRLAVTSYTTATLRGMLQQYSASTTISDVRAVIIGSLSKALADGWHEGGNCVYAWDPEVQRIIRWPPLK
jgi:GGDEF domain-containing protein